MNRYIIVFTIVTVLYPPPSLIAVRSQLPLHLRWRVESRGANITDAEQTVFGTQLFNSSNVAEPISKFKVSTIAISLGTYILAIFLVWLADRLEHPHAIIRDLQRDFRLWKLHLRTRAAEAFRQTVFLLTRFWQGGRIALDRYRFSRSHWRKLRCASRRIDI